MITKLRHSTSTQHKIKVLRKVKQDYSKTCI